MATEANAAELVRLVVHVTEAGEGGWSVWMHHQPGQLQHDRQVQLREQTK